VHKLQAVSRPVLSLILPIHGVDPEQVFAAARSAERAELGGLWVPDHLLNAGHPTNGVLECWTLLAALAGRTVRLPIGPLVLTTPFRHPVLVAKSAATLASLAPGRLRLGLGSGGMTYAKTCQQFGYPELSPGERVAHCRETAKAIRTLLEKDPGTYQNQYVNAQEVRIWPRPDRCPPIILAARRPGMLRATAELADGWNCPLPHELADGLSALEAAGRPRDSIHVSVFSILVLGRDRAEASAMLSKAGRAAQLFGDVERHHLFGDPADVADRIRALADAGADEVTLDVRGAPVDQIVDRLAREVIPLLGS
jgi:alkanesulfonate monooxygenase SsuD/methylene tetrahydromethanopterin reductase-like flavin-dependent oxidoreductase (luciferase family)